MRMNPTFFILALGGLVATTNVSLAGCLIRGTSYRMNSDTVEWGLSTSSGENCGRTFRAGGRSTFTGVRIGSPPRNGSARVGGMGFSYKSKAGFKGSDSFTVLVSGTTAGSGAGTSTIKVDVTVQ